MKKIHYLLSVLLVFSSFSLVAQFVILSGTTLVVPANTSMPFPDGIFIESGGTLKIESGAYVGIGVDKKIRILDGGFINSQNGTISVIHEALPGNWYGIEIDGTASSNPSLQPSAITMIGGSIRRADVALRMDQSNFRKLTFNGVTFDQNEYHIVAQAGTTLAPCGSLFRNCYFLRATGIWPILIGYMNGLTFSGCLFNNQSNSVLRMVHIDGPKEVLIDDCTFIYRKNAISFHYFVQSSTISNCTFYYDENSNSSNFDVIQIGVEISGTNGLVTVVNNDIYANGKDWITNGIHVGNSVSEAVTITGNRIGGAYTGAETLGFENGINFEKANDGYNEISENTIENCINGILSGTDNPNLAIYCNVLNNNDIHLLVTGYLAPQLQNGFDPNNQFIGNRSFDIYNAYHNPLLYNTLHFVPINSHPPLFNFNVKFEFVPYVSGCYTPVPGGGHTGGGDGKEREDTPAFMLKEIAFSVYPNPASNRVTGSIELEEEESAQVTLVTSLGQIAHEQSIAGSQQVSFDVSTLPSGTYFFTVTSDSGKVKRKPVMIMR